MQKLEDDKLVNQVDQALKNVIRQTQRLAASIQKWFSEEFQNLITKLRKEASYTLKRAKVKLQDEKGNSNYQFTFSHTPIDFKAEPLKQSITSLFVHLQESISTTVNTYMNDLVQNNISRNNNTTILHLSNSINSMNNEWYSVTSKDTLRKSEVKIEGFDSISTTYLAIGVSDKPKNYGKCMTSNIAKEGFLGCIYLNGRLLEDQYIRNVNLKMSSIPKAKFSFTVQDKERHLIIERSDTKKRQELVLGNNVKFYLYIAWKGPIQFRVT